jgi:shikimate dehydrogenase
MEKWSQVISLLTNKPLEGQSTETLDYFGGIVGGDEPSRYSRSPTLWNRFFEAFGLRGFFTALDLPPYRPFATFVRAVLDVPGWIDLTITSPYKGVAYQILSSLPIRMVVTERVHHLGCLNHMILHPQTGEAYVDMTDGQGMVRALRRRQNLRDANILLAGAGGAAAAIAYELVREGADLRIANIIEEDAYKLVQQLQPHSRPSATLSVCSWEKIGQEAQSSNIIISAISQSTPLERVDVERLPNECLLADTRYGARAEFVKIARTAGRDCVDGREMLYGQFALAAAVVGSNICIPSETLDSTLANIEKWFMSQ